jgi:hypothetical protein
MHMTDPETETPEKRGPGRPKGSRSAGRQPPQRGVHRGSYSSDAPAVRVVSYQPYEPKSTTDIPTDIVQEIWDFYDGHLQWVAFEAAGKPTPEWVTARQKNGFVDVRRGDFDGKLDYLCNADGRAVVGGLVLMCRPREYEDQARSYEKRKATRAIEQMKASHAEQGASGITMPGGAEHETALRGNRHKRSYVPYERDRIPD